jgi:hypothetical protein
MCVCVMDKHVQNRESIVKGAFMGEQPAEWAIYCVLFSNSPRRASYRSQRQAGVSRGVLLIGPSTQTRPLASSQTSVTVPVTPSDPTLQHFLTFLLQNWSLLAGEELGKQWFENFATLSVKEASWYSIQKDVKCIQKFDRKAWKKEIISKN